MAMNWVERVARKLDPEGWARTDEFCARANVLVAYHRERTELLESMTAELSDPNTTCERLLEMWDWLDKS